MLLPLSIAATVLVVDQVAKGLIRANMTLGQSIPPDGRFRLTYYTNAGGIFSLPLNSTFLMVFAAAVVVLIGWLYFRYLPLKGGLLRIGLGLVLGGAVGNLMDRVRFGMVTDFLDVRLWGEFHWPIFNVADASLSIGVLALAYSLLTKGRSEEWHQKAVLRQ